MTPEETQNLIQNADTLNTTYLGTRSSNLGNEENIGIQDSKRVLHTVSTGPTGSGKTQLMIHAALQDAYKGNGFCFINPKGDAIDELLTKLPDDRLDDVVYLNPGREEPPSINVLRPHGVEQLSPAQLENQKEIIVSDLIDLFKRQSENWGDRFGRVLETLFRAHLAQNIEGENRSLLDVYQCVVDENQLTQLINDTGDEVIREQLVRVKEDLSDYELEPVQRRLNDFLMNSVVRSVVASGDSSVDFRDAVREKKIILVDAQKGEVGETPAQLVGSIVMTQVWAAAQSRINEPLSDREPFYLYVDELQNFAGEGSNVAKILAEAREYRLGCWFATQYLNNLPTEMKRAVLNNCRTKIIFNPSDSDDFNQITRLLNGISKTELLDLGAYRCAVQRPGQQQQYNTVILDTYPPWNTDHIPLDQLKNRLAPTPGEQKEIESTTSSLGPGNNAGGDQHKRLLTQAQNQLEEGGGVQVTLLYQEPGSDEPDGLVSLPDDTTAHLEAEHTTLSKPSKVLQNLQRAAEQDRETIFVVAQGNRDRLENILEDPVNRNGTTHEDHHGDFDYYTTSDGDPVDQLEEIHEAEYRIIEIDLQTESAEPECPLLDDNPRDELETFCLARSEEGHCSELDQTCVLLEDSEP